MGGSCVELGIEESVATVTLVPGEPGKPPTIDLDFLSSLDARICQVAELLGPGPDGRVSVRVVVVRSDSEKYFCAGADISVLETLDQSTIGAWIDRGHQVFRRLESLPVPVVAVVGGYALGGGLELALACDLIYSTTTAQFGQTETRLGFVPGWGGSYRVLRRVGLARAKDLLFTGRVLGAREAMDIGIVDFLSDPLELEHQLDELLSAVCSTAPQAVAATKDILSALADNLAEPALHALALERQHSVALIGEEETKARVEAFLRSRGRV